MAEHKDKYANFAELRANEQSRDFRVVTKQRNSRTAIIAPHGGRIEPGTSETATAIAGQDLSLALFEGLKAEKNFEDLHITSTRFDEPQCMEVVARSDFVLAIHGKKRQQNAVDEEIVYIGGLDLDLRELITRELELADFVVQIPGPGLQGIEPGNICNRGRRGRGVQFELTRGLRRSFFEPLYRARQQRPPPSLQRFVEAVRRGLRRGGAL
ncbi:MAG TPA: poly-gamma-glutamate hydrolase family protein [Roseiflexaceae bacterium]|nr:poly-gamma-glutamate hydrolase family protein [Roseiflexaceae bacterium]